MTSTPLNPDAVTAVARALNEAGWTCYEGGIEPGEYDECEDCKDVCDKIARKALAALSVAQPVVNSVEELDALPVGSVVRGGEDDLVGEKIRLSPYLPHWCTIGEEVEADKRDLLPARVLYRPEVSDA